MGQAEQRSEVRAYAESICRDANRIASAEVIGAMDEFCETLDSSPRCLDSGRIVALLDEVQMRLDECELGGGRGRACDPLFRALAAVQRACGGGERRGET
jgi:hypothetical protein